MINTISDKPVILDFSDIPPAKRQEAIDYLINNRISLHPVKTDGRQESFRFMWEKKIPAHESLIFQKAYPQLKKLGLIVEDFQNEPFKYNNYQAPASYQTPVGAIELDFINIPAVQRKNVVHQFHKLGIELTAANADTSDTEETKLKSATKYLVKPEHIETFFDSTHAKILLNKYKIETVYGQKPLPAPSDKIPQQVIQARINRQNAIKAEQERLQRLQEAYIFEQTMHAIKEAKKPFYLKPRPLLKAGVASLILSAAINPVGTSAFVDDTLHGRFFQMHDKMLRSLAQLPEGIHNLMQPDLNQEHKSSFFNSPVSSSFTLIKNGMFNVAETGFNITGSLISSGAYALKPFIDTDEKTLGIGNLTYRNFEKDTQAFLKNAFFSIDAKTGLKSNDTIFSIIEDGRIKAAKAFLRQNPLMPDLYHNGDFGITPFRYALMQKQPQIADIIFEDGRGYSNFPSSDGTTALMFAIEQAAALKGDKRQPDMIALAAKMIGSPMVDIYTRDKNGKNAADYIIENAVPELVEPIFKRGLLNKINSAENPLIFRVLDNPQMIEALVKTGQSLFSIDQSGTCALLAAFELNEANNYQSDAAITACLNLLSAGDITSLRFDPVYAEHIEQWEKRNPDVANTLFENKNSLPNKTKESAHSFNLQAKNTAESSR